MAEGAGFLDSTDLKQGPAKNSPVQQGYSGIRAPFDVFVILFIAGTKKVAPLVLLLLEDDDGPFGETSDTIGPQQ